MQMKVRHRTIINTDRNKVTENCFDRIKKSGCSNKQIIMNAGF